MTQGDNDNGSLQAQLQQGTPAIQQQQQPQPPMPPMREGISSETRQAMLEWEIAALRREITDLRETIDELNADKEKFMRWGIMALGAAVLGMGTWIFNFVFSHVKS